jgi:prepilin-type N-terminal cleavage/methylation domain-containing protein
VVFRQEDGLTLVELLVALALFSVISVSVYQTVFSVARGSDLSTAVAGATQEARLGFNRMVRDTRQASSIQAISSTSYTIQVDFDFNGTITPAGSLNAQGDYETLTYSYDSASQTIGLGSDPSVAPDVLMAGVTPVTTTTPPCRGRIFCYVSNRLEHDVGGDPDSTSAGDGTTTCLELDRTGAPGVGNNDGTCGAAEWPLITTVRFSMVVTQGRSANTFRAEAGLRNTR